MSSLSAETRWFSSGKDACFPCTMFLQVYKKVVHSCLICRDIRELHIVSPYGTWTGHELQCVQNNWFKADEHSSSTEKAADLGIRELSPDNPTPFQPRTNPIRTRILYTCFKNQKSWTTPSPALPFAVLISRYDPLYDIRCWRRSVERSKVNKYHAPRVRAPESASLILLHALPILWQIEL